MTDYVYSFGILRTGEKLVELPCSGVSMDAALNAAGTWQGTFYLDSKGVSNIDAVTATTPGYSYVAVFRDGTLIWYGIITAREYQSSAKVASLTARTLEYYPSRVLIDEELHYASQDERYIFTDLWNIMQSSSMRNIDVNIPEVDTLLSATAKTLDVYVYDYKYFGEAMDDLANGDDGFDYTIDVTADDNGNFTKTLRVGNPQLGSLSDPNGLVFEYVDNRTGGGGDITQYYKTANIGSAGTHVWALGAGEGSDMLVGAADVANKFIVNGLWLRYDIKVPNKGATDQASLDAIARQEMIVRTPPMDVITTEVKADKDPVFGSYRLGDACQLQINDPMHPYPSDLRLSTRLIGWSLTPSSSDSTDIANLTFQNEDDSGD